ncbi:SCO family protein [Hymenobacter sp. DH14]|uniref:SCO family protein n=1 Tax=Hymenobacter cyanobacteriorum TaxID=2926463 RepID=A0A9X1VEH3_9BACT|nr:SCO family protein [Hymenobacter cyanobacteriorum]MCI1187212.1 SCO family protein [Hymenobacter cyanobacteriorum]
MTLKRLLLLPALAGTLLAPACTAPPKEAAQLPILGERDIRPRADGGPADTLATPVPAFALRDQAGQPVSNATFAGRAYLADFFFATCPGICPKLQSEMLSVFKLYPTDARLGFLSITIDPAHDSTAVLRDYAQRLGVPDANRWHFATLGDRAATFTLANRFLTGVMPDTQSPGGLAHNGTLALIDDRGYIRGAYDGMNAQEVARLKAELPLLLAEIDARKKGVAGR